MALRDQPMRCGACGYRFVFTVREQRQRAELGLWESGTLLFCPRCKSADVQPVETGLVDAEEPRQERQPAVEHADRPRDSERESAPGGPGARRSGAGDDRRGGRPGSRDGGPPRAGHGRPGGRPGGRPSGRPSGGTGGRTDRHPPRQTDLRVRYVGIVKWFDTARGYGFIADDEGGELFLHASGILVADATSMREGTPVEYEIEHTGRGPQAVDVVPLA